MPSTLVAFRITSALISIARSAAAVSVLKYGLPVPAPNTTTRPFSRWRLARRRVNGSATARRRRTVAHVRLACAGPEAHHATLLEVADGAPPDERLGHGAHLDRGDDAGVDALLLDGILQRQRVDHGGEHPHVVGGRAVHAA